MVSQPMTYLKALASAASSSILPWLVGILAAWCLSLGYPMPDSVQAGFVALIAGLIVYFVPNAPVQPTVAELQAQIAALKNNPVPALNIPKE